MTEETKRELIKAHCQDYSVEQIAKIMGFSEDEITTIIKENPEMIEEAEMINYD